MDNHRKEQKQHILIVTYPVQGHINPGLHLARRLALTTGALVTFSTAASAHLRLFPHATSADEEVTDGALTFIPYSDSENNSMDPRSYPDRPSCRSLASVISDLASRGRRVTFVIYTLLLTWAADVARQLSIPCAEYWIQPAAAFVAFYHYFHGHDSLIDSHANEPLFPLKLPGLPPMQIRDLPSFIVTATTGGPYSAMLSKFRLDFEALYHCWLPSRPKILVNTFDELEPEALAAVDGVELIAVGPIISDEGRSPGLDLFKADGDEKGYSYMEWLESKPERSVVYVSFGSLSVLDKEQLEVILKGLKASGRPYLWVVRKDCRYEGFESELEDDGMVVEWCSQLRVLSHASVGCFVTHCGWNSTTESLVFGVPTVGAPMWADQGTNAMLMEKVWGTGVRVGANEDGVLDAAELKRCLDLVMGDNDRGREIRMKAEYWKGKAREAVNRGGSSDRNLRAFIDGLSYDDHLHFVHE